jgi:hypothetical protein
MPGTKLVSSNIRELKRKHPDWAHERVVATAYSQARRAGADTPKKRK